MKVNVNGCRNIDSKSYKYNDGKAIMENKDEKRILSLEEVLNLLPWVIYQKFRNKQEIKFCVIILFLSIQESVTILKYLLRFQQIIYTFKYWSFLEMFLSKVFQFVQNVYCKTFCSKTLYVNIFYRVNICFMMILWA